MRSIRLWTAAVALALGTGAGGAVRSEPGHGAAASTPGKGEHAHEAATTQTLQGELLDMACYMAHEGKGEKHKSCAQACIKGGAPMGVLTSDGKVVLLVEDHAAKKPYESLKAEGGEQVKVTGALQERGGLTALVVQSFELVK